MGGKKKYLRFKVQRIELNESQINPETGVIELNLSFNAVTNENRAFLSHNGKELSTTKYIQGYFGENKARTTLEIPKDKDDLTNDPILKLLRFDHIIAIDTNTKKINNINTSIGRACVVEIGMLQNSLVARIHPLKKIFKIDKNTSKPENENWKNLMEYIINQDKYKPDKNIGIVVDSDLGNIDKFNNQEEPIIENFYLPKNFKLIYAKDKPKDSILNIAISKCDKLANLNLKEM